MYQSSFVFPDNEAHLVQNFTTVCCMGVLGTKYIKINLMTASVDRVQAVVKPLFSTLLRNGVKFKGFKTHIERPAAFLNHVLAVL